MNLFLSPDGCGIMPIQYENSTMQLDYIEYVIGITLSRTKLTTQQRILIKKTRYLKRTLKDYRLSL
jgi:hypothetical protein